MTTISVEHQEKMQASRTTSKSSVEQLQDARLGVGPAEMARIEKRVSQMPKTCVATYLRALRGRSMAAAIKAHCMECVGWNRGDVAGCTSVACALYPYRPFK